MFIDNTNAKCEDFNFYLQLAHNNDYIVSIIETDINTDIDLCFHRNKNKISKDQIEHIRSIYEENIGYYYGWCISLSNTLDLRGFTCSKILSHSIDINAFKNFAFHQNIHKIENLFHVYHMKASSSSKNVLHVTSCYTNNGRCRGSKNYVKSKDVIDSMGAVDQLQIIGLCITEKCLFARVLLSEKQKLLWGNNDACNGEINELYKGCNFDNNSIPGHELGKSYDGGIWRTQFSPEKLNERVNQIYSFIQNIKGDYLLPDFGVGCTAHITLGVVDGFNPVISGDNLKAIISLELEEKPKVEYSFPNEMVRCYGDNLWTMYFKEIRKVPAMFCGTYFAEKSP